MESRPGQVSRLVQACEDCRRARFYNLNLMTGLTILLADSDVRLREQAITLPQQHERSSSEREVAMSNIKNNQKRRADEEMRRKWFVK
jgi:hypothetical protein